MKHGLLKKLFLCCFLFFALGFLLFYTVVPAQVERYLTEQKGHELTVMGERLSLLPSVSSCSFADEDIKQLRELLHSFSDSEVAGIWLIDQEGRVVLSTESADPMAGRLQIPDYSMLSEGASFWVTGDFFGLLPPETLSAVVPVKTSPRTIGCIIIHCPLSLLQDSIKDLSGLCFLFLILIDLFALLPIAGFYLLFYRPMEHTASAAAAYASGNLQYPLPADHKDEFAPLNASLKYMADNISQSEEYQRNFLSNVSHDFRSPLTSIKGYAEAILDGTIQKEEQDRYLEIILSETDRLYHLTKNILTSNRLGDSGMHLDLTVFDLHQVIHSIAAAMEIQCREKDIHLVLALRPGSQHVRADKEKIQQVIYNLLDNAIKFSHSHSTVTVSTYRKKRCVFVSVRDNGIGIPAEQIPRIWSRFYKSDSSRGKNKRGTGLGLSIVREIIQAHGQNINVISTEGVGSEFIFTLEKS